MPVVRLRNECGSAHACPGRGRIRQRCLAPAGGDERRPVRRSLGPTALRVRGADAEKPECTRTIVEKLRGPRGHRGGAVMRDAGSIPIEALGTLVPVDEETRVGPEYIAIL
ncbi:hypothetical protein NDU88_001555 [Pleurodeles waltl]|uniref:Uncharacterized protein n=1 Tax=Pleurodeles waltl TaxID=8319 RepID=A0AAV7NB32_PLEWA|nr:hypothetical protein NDU88_001555 [Pleurodeles waltl]